MAREELICSLKTTPGALDVNTHLPSPLVCVPQTEDAFEMPLGVTSPASCPGSSVYLDSRASLSFHL
jgi:hypothetical protein